MSDTTEDPGARVDELEEQLDELEKKLAEVTEERDSLRRENTELAEKVDTAKDLVGDLSRGLNK